LENQSDLFHIEAKVLPGSRLIGGSIASNKLRNLDHFFVAEIVRGDFVIGPVHPSEVIREGDVLIFVGDVRFIADLQTIGGLETELSNRPMRGDSIYHAVVASNSILAGATLKGMSFRSHFDASVLAIRRGRERLSGKLGEIEIHAGDVLVISAGPDFFARDDVQPNLHVLEVEDPGQPALGLHDSVLIVSLFLSLIGLALSGLIDLGFATLILVLAALAMGWLREREVRRTFPFDLVILLWGSLTLGLLLDKSGLADVIANGILSMTDGYHPVLGLITLFMVTWILTEFLSNNSAALAAFPIALALATRLSLPAEAYVLAVAFGASASFLIPFGYQTHLMVLTPGKYRFSDFLSLGVVVFLFYGAASMTTISLLYLR